MRFPIKFDILELLRKMLGVNVAVKHPIRTAKCLRSATVVVCPRQRSGALAGLRQRANRLPQRLAAALGNDDVIIDVGILHDCRKLRGHS